MCLRAGQHTIENGKICQCKQCRVVTTRTELSKITYLRLQSYIKHKTSNTYKSQAAYIEMKLPPTGKCEPVSSVGVLAHAKWHPVHCYTL